MSAGLGDPEASNEGGETTDEAVGTPLVGDVDGRSDRDGDGSPAVPAVPAGRIGRAHGLDGSFYVTGARPRLLAVGTEVSLGGRTCTVVRRAGTDEHPIVRLTEIEDRLAAEALRGRELTVELAQAPVLEEGEWWALELTGCEVVDGERRIGTVIGLVELPSCEALEVQRFVSEADGQRKPVADQLLVPMVSDAIRHVDPKQKRIDVNMAFLGEG